MSNEEDGNLLAVVELCSGKWSVKHQQRDGLERSRNAGLSSNDQQSVGTLISPI